MRIKVSRYDPQKEDRIFPDRPDPRKQDLIFLKILIIVLFIIIALLIANASIRGPLHKITGILQGAEMDYNRRLSPDDLWLTVDGELYHLESEYIHNDGRSYKIDHVQEMIRFLRTSEVMNHPIEIQFIQRFGFDRREIVGARCEKAELVNLEYSLKARRDYNSYLQIICLAMLLICAGMYFFRKKYSISIER